MCTRVLNHGQTGYRKFDGQKDSLDEQPGVAMGTAQVGFLSSIDKHLAQNSGALATSYGQLVLAVAAVVSGSSLAPSPSSLRCKTTLTF